MSAKANYFKIGLFIVCATALALGGIIALGAGTLFEHPVLVETFIDESVQGLEVGSPIKFRGVKIGTVKQIDFVGHRYQSQVDEKELSRYAHYVVVIGAIRQTPDELSEEQRAAKRKQDYAAGLRVRLASQGITGVLYLEADFLNPQQYPPLEVPWETKGIYVPSAPSTITLVSQALGNIAKDLSQANVHQIAEHFDALILAMTTLANQANLAELRGRAGEVLSELQGTVHGMHRLVYGGEMKTILSDVAAAVREAKQFISDLSPASKDIRIAAETLPTTITRVDKSVRRIAR